MAIRPEDLPKDAAALAEMVLAFDSENEDLRAEIATLKGLIFGARSERSAIICAEQLAFDLERTADVQPPANDDEVESDTPRSKRRKPRRNIGALPAHLPRVEQVIEPASTLCPCCAGQMHRIGEETSEALDRVPAWLRVLRTIRPKYASHGEPRVKGSFHLRTGTPLVVSVSECQALLHDAALLPSLINLTSGRRSYGYGCTNIPLAADRAWDDETILPVRQ
jgi:zinc-finger binding domain of transposase IS66/Transposase C of IS166 homeodomain